MAEIIVAEDAVAVGWDSIYAVEAFGPGWRGVAREVAVLNDKGAVIERNVFNDRRRRPGAMIDEDDRIVNMKLGVMAADARSTREAEINIGQAALHGCADEIEAAPVCGGSWVTCEADVLRIGPFGQNLAGPVHRDRCPGCYIDRRAGLNGECHTIRNGKATADVIGAIRG